MNARVSKLLAASLLALTFGCGGRTPTAPVVVASPTPAPVPSPTPSPSPSNCPDGACGNKNTVARTQLRLYLLFDENRDLVPAPDPVKGIVGDPIPVGYTVRLDVTGRDTDGRETDGRGDIEWFFSDDSVVDDIERTPWQHDLKILKPGKLIVYVVFDGVGSNDLQFTFVEKKK